LSLKIPDRKIIFNSKKRAKSVNGNIIKRPDARE